MIQNSDFQPAAEQPASGGERAARSRFSLHRLSAAFARLTGSEPASPAQADAIGLDQNAAAPAVAELAGAIPSPQMIVEAMLFVGQADGQPLTSRLLASQIRDVSPPEVETIIAALNKSYAASGCSYRIESEGAGFRMQLCPQYDTLRQRLGGRTKQIKLSPQAVEVLAVVAYRQPISAEEVAKARGSRSEALLAQLIRRGLLRLDRPADTRQPVYCTTERFNQLLNIRSVAELPHSEDLDDN